MSYQHHFNQLIRLRADYWKSPSVSLQNLKLSQMVLHANACGLNVVEFVMEGATETQEANLKAKASEKQKLFVVAKAAKAKSKAVLDSHQYQCPFCDFTTQSIKSLNGHKKRHSSKYKSFDKVS
jgi:hypothetical protein